MALPSYWHRPALITDYCTGDPIETIEMVGHVAHNGVSCIQDFSGEI